MPITQRGRRCSPAKVTPQNNNTDLSELLGSLRLSRQIADDHVSNVEDFLHVGQDVQVRVIEVDVDNCRLGLSMREPRQKRAGGNGPRGAKRDVSVLVGRDPEQFITGRVSSTTGWVCSFFQVGSNMVAR